MDLFVSINIVLPPRLLDCEISGKVLLEPLLALLLTLVHGLLVLVAGPITSQSESMNLILVDSQLVRNAGLLSHEILNLSYGLIVEQGILVTNGERQWLGYWIEVTWHSDQGRVAGDSCIHSTFNRAQDCISASPAEANGTDLASSWNISDCVDEAVDQWLGDSLTVLGQPRHECGTNIHGTLGLVNQARLLTDLEWWLDALEEFEW